MPIVGRYSIDNGTQATQESLLISSESWGLDLVYLIAKRQCLI
jgi:hypothetical protein